MLELTAFAIFFLAVSRHRPNGSSTSPLDGAKRRFDPWIWVIAAASTGLLFALIANLATGFYLALKGTNPAFPHVFDQRYLVLVAWGFLVPFVWGFSAKWMGIFLGLKTMRPRLLLTAVAINFAGTILTFMGSGSRATGLFVLSTALAIAALRMFERAQREAKTRGVDRSFSYFIRMAYGWLMVAALLGVVAARWDTSGGIWGASRHALTVGFVAVMVLSVGQRILPAFGGMRLLWSTRLMLTGLALLVTGCTMRVSCEIVAYHTRATLIGLGLCCPLQPCWSWGA